MRSLHLCVVACWMSWIVPFSAAVAQSEASAAQRAEAAAVGHALVACRAGRAEAAADSLAVALRQLPRAYDAAELLARLVSGSPQGAELLESMETWTIPPTSLEVGLPSAWLLLRARLIVETQPLLARGLLVQALGKAREPLLPAAEQLAGLVEPDEVAGLEAELRELGAAAVNLGSVAVVLAARGGQTRLALDRLEPVLAAAPEALRLRALRASLLLRLGRPGEALEAAERAVLAARRSPDPHLLAEVLLLYGQSLAGTGNAAEAERAFAAGAKAAAEACDVQLEVRLRVESARLLAEAGRLAQAEAAYRSILASDAHNADALAAIAELLAAAGAPEPALEAYTAAARAFADDGRRQPLAALHAGWGSTLANLGRGDEALSTYREGLELAAALGDRQLQAQLLRLAARCWRTLRNPQRAVALLEAAQAVTDRGLPEAERAAVACELAEAHAALGDGERALAAAAACRDLAALVSARVPALRFRATAARVLLDLGRVEAAIAVVDADSVPEPAANAAPELREAYAELSLQRGRAAAALDPPRPGADAALRTAARQAAALGLTSTVWRAHLVLGRLAARQGRRDEAAEQFTLALQAVEHSRGDVNAPGELADRSPARFAPYEELVELLLASPASGPAGSRPDAGRRGAGAGAPPVPASIVRAWEVADRRAGRRLRDLVVRPLDAASSDAERRLLARDAELARKLFWLQAAQAAPVLDARHRYHLEAWLRESPLDASARQQMDAAAAWGQKPPRLVELLADLERGASAERRGVLGELISLSPRLAVLVEPRPIPLAELQSVLAPDELWLQYVCGPARTSVFVLTRARAAVAEAPACTALAQTAEAFVRSLERAPRSGQAFDPAAGVELYRSLVGTPLEQTGIRALPARLSVLADGPVLDLPLAGLPRPEGGFLVESSLPVRLPAAWWRVAAEAREARARRASGALFFAAPFLPVRLEDRRIQLEGTSIAAEHFSAAADVGERNPQSPFASVIEAEAAAQHLPGARLLLEGDALERRVKQPEAAAAAVLHFAAPAYSDGRRPPSSGVVLARGEDGDENGFLELAEILSLRLAAELVTLSGATPAGTGGVQDLAAAFLLAGAERVVTTLWQAQDEASVHLMERLYRRRAQLGAAAALQAAQRELLSGTVQDTQGRTLRKLAHPHFWAGYQIFGSP